MKGERRAGKRDKEKDEEEDRERDGRRLTEVTLGQQSLSVSPSCACLCMQECGIVMCYMYRGFGILRVMTSHLSLF